MGIEYGERRSTFIDYGRPSLFLDFAKRKSLVDAISRNNLITFTRSSTGTYVGSDGYIKTAAADEPRFDHDPVTGESLGLLIEESRFNRHLNSNISGVIIYNPFGSFTKSTDNTILTPYGDFSGVAKITTLKNPVGGFATGRWGSSVGTMAAGTTYTFSFFIKGQQSLVNLLRAGYQVFSPTYEESAISVGSLSSQTYPNDWKRYYWTYTPQNTQTGIFYLGIQIGNIPVGTIYYTFGFQLEQGSFPTSYIPTSGSAVTRQPDNIKITGTNFTDFYNSDEGTIYSEYTYGIRPWHFADDDESPYQRFFAFADPSGGIRVGRNTGSYTYLSAPTTGSYGRGDNIKSVAAYDNTNFVVGAFGQVATSGTTNGNTGIDRLLFYQVTSNPDTNGTIKKLLYYPTRLTDTQLQALTQ